MDCTTRKIVVVVERLNRVTGDEIVSEFAAVNVRDRVVKEPKPLKAPVVLLTPAMICVAVAPAPAENWAVPATSQSPAVSETLVAFAGVLFVSDVPEVVFEANSPILPAFALSFVVVPTMPFVLDGVNAPVLLSVVNAPVLAAVLPIGPGDAKRFTNPVPLTVELADSVVKAPVFAAVLPIGGGEAKKVVNPAPLTVEVADNVVNAPVFGVVAPTVPLSAPPVEVSVVNAPVPGVVAPIFVLLIPPVALNPPVCAHAPVPLVDVMPLMPEVCPPVIASAFVKPVNASLAKPNARTVLPHVTNAFLLFALRIESMNWTVGFGLL